ncbi:MAG: M48 family metallopeptidase, partial [Cytophagales bacterium]|nr:M48 family metallopeptidase [Cytophagales bacterium]
NAFAWRDGSIFINIGLLRYLENEAQLAYIMAHEIQHYQKEHALMQFKKKKDLESIFNRQSELDAFMEQMKYSRTHELEADAEGFELYSQSDYSLLEARKALEILKIVDSDFYTDSLNLLEVLSSETFKIDSSWLCNEEEVMDLADVGYSESGSGRGRDNQRENTNQGRTRNTVTDKYETAEDREETEEDSTIDDDDEEEDRYSTHPSLKKRLKELNELLAGKDTSSGAAYLVSEKRFNQVQQIVTFEVVHEYYKDADYFRSLYESLQLQKQYPQNEYLKEISCQSLFWIAYYFNLNSVNEIMDDYEKYADQEYGKFLCFFYYIEENDLIDMAVHFIRDAHKTYPANETIEIALARLLPLNRDSREAKNIYKDFSDNHPGSIYTNFSEAMKKKKKL